MSNVKISPNGPVTEFLADLDACEGKTIKSVSEECPSYTDYRVIRFTDGSALALREIEDGGHDLGGETFDSRFSLKDRVYFGLSDAAEYEAQQAQEAAARATEAENQERAQLARLQAKYAGK